MEMVCSVRSSCGLRHYRSHLLHPWQTAECTVGGRPHCVRPSTASNLFAFLKDDTVTAKAQESGFAGGLFSVVVETVTGTEEEQLAEAMKDVGPFVAIGRPGEALPELGAGRPYASHAEWQDQVGQLISKAQLVVL